MGCEMVARFAPFLLEIDEETMLESKLDLLAPSSFGVWLTSLEWITSTRTSSPTTKGSSDWPLVSRLELALI